MNMHAHPLEWTWLGIAIAYLVLSALSLQRHIRNLREIRKSKTNDSADFEVANLMASISIRDESGRLVICTAMVLTAFTFLRSAPPPPDAMPAQTINGLIMLIFITFVLVVLSLLARLDRKRLNELYDRSMKFAKPGGKRRYDPPASAAADTSATVVLTDEVENKVEGE